MHFLLFLHFGFFSFLYQFFLSIYLLKLILQFYFSSCFLSSSYFPFSFFLSLLSEIPGLAGSGAGQAASGICVLGILQLLSLDSIVRISALVSAPSSVNIIISVVSPYRFCQFTILCVLLFVYLVFSIYFLMSFTFQLLSDLPFLFFIS